MITPMVARLVPDPFDREGWLFELKWDGFRTIAETDGTDGVKLYSRNQTDFKKRFPPIADAGGNLKEVSHLGWRDRGTGRAETQAAERINRLSRALTFSFSPGSPRYLACRLKKYFLKILYFQSLYMRRGAIARTRPSASRPKNSKGDLTIVFEQTIAVSWSFVDRCSLRLRLMWRSAFPVRRASAPLLPPAKGPGGPTLASRR
jgi:hypothetical protein